ncbi:MAG TPA: PilZ domain-containing protein [Xanthobacteraceae bacterium]|nr:PilZ domain-containing protein [Xanthobacteraceae bacterium]
MPERRIIERYRFGQGYTMRLMARDGSWQVPCTIIDVSQTGAKLHLDAPIDGIELKDFILKLSQFGTAQRDCELAWHRGDFIGVRFTKQFNPLASPTDF